MSLKLNCKYLGGFINEKELLTIQSDVKKAHSYLYENSSEALGNNFHGWLNLPENYDREEFLRIKSCAAKVISDSDALVVIGIGGSYLGARAAVEFVKSKNYNLTAKNTPMIFFLGNSVSPSEISEVYSLCEGCDFSVNVISKSGTTTEPAIAFRIFKRLLEKKYGAKKAAERIYVTTDKNKGTLKFLADKQGYEKFKVPDDVGGRFSALTAVGLLPMACAGVDIDRLMAGAAAAAKKYCCADIENNDCYKYAALRNLLYRKGKSIEMFISYEPDFTMMNEWLKQLFGESEGKDGKGIFPASAIYSTDLHSLGQYVQEGVRLMFETVATFATPKAELIIPNEEDDADGLNFLAGKQMSYINAKAFEGTVLAHTDGGVPNIIIESEAMDEENLGELIYFFEKACAVSAYILGVNPFDQPGVESYKKNMFALLGKPGYEKLAEKLKKRLG